MLSEREESPSVLFQNRPRGAETDLAIQLADGKTDANTLRHCDNPFELMA